MILNKKYGTIILIILMIFMVSSTSSYGQKTSITISIAGDVMLGDWIGTYMEKHGVDYPWEGMKNIFLESDLSLINLESPVGTIGEAQDKQFTYRAKPEVLKGLVDAGVDGVTLGNNHTLDFGRECFVQTLDNLESYGVKYTGGGRDIEAAYKPAIWDINGMKVGYLGLSRVTPNVSWYATESRAGTANGYDSNAKNIITAVQQAKEKVDFLIVSFHWGIERADYPRDNDVNMAKQLIDNGADCIIGHHPHVLQGIEFYKDRPIVYSLGNFIFGTTSERTSQTMIFNIEINKDGIINTSITPGMIKTGKPSISEGEERNKVINLINHLSSDWGTKVLEDGNIVGNIEYVFDNTTVTDSIEHSDISVDNDVNKDSTNKKHAEDIFSNFNDGKSITDIFITVMTNYGKEIFIGSGVMIVVILVALIKMIR